MNKFILASTFLLTTSAMAHEDHGIQISSDQCQVDFQNDVRITPNQLQITAENNKQLTIKNKPCFASLLAEKVPVWTD